jgi:hypothetical protein
MICSFLLVEKGFAQRVDPILKTATTSQAALIPNPESRLFDQDFRRVAGLGYRSSRRGRWFESSLRHNTPK